MHISPEQVLKAVDEQRANLARLSHQFNADEFKIVMPKSLALVVQLQELIAEQTRRCEELAQ
jgi:hypothetical protein